MAAPIPRVPPVTRATSPLNAAMCASSDPLENAGDPLSAADAHRHERVPPARAVKLGDRLDRQNATRRADRMPERDRAAVRVHLAGIKPQLFGHRACLRGE